MQDQIIWGVGKMLSRRSVSEFWTIMVVVEAELGLFIPKWGRDSGKEVKWGPGTARRICS